MKYKFSRFSKNAKTGPIPTTMTEKNSCAPSCPFKGSGCYAENFPLVLWWDKVERDGITFEKLCSEIDDLPRKQLWRHNVAGDLDHFGGFINRDTLEKLTLANYGRKGFTYTHHKMSIGENAQAVQTANANGFTVNASCNSVEEATEIQDKYKVPVVAVVPSDETRKSWKLESGHTVVLCPATYNKKINCINCGACALPNRKPIIAFPAHGARWKVVDRTIGRDKSEKSNRQSTINFHPARPENRLHEGGAKENP